MVWHYYKDSEGRKYTVRPLASYPGRDSGWLTETKYRGKRRTFCRSGTKKGTLECLRKGVGKIKKVKKKY